MPMDFMRWNLSCQWDAHARIVHLSGNDLHGLAVHQEIFLIGGEDVLGAVIGLRHGHGSGHTQMGGQQQNGKKGIIS